MVGPFHLRLCRSGLRDGIFQQEVSPRQADSGRFWSLQPSPQSSHFWRGGTRSRKMTHTQSQLHSLNFRCRFHYSRSASKCGGSLTIVDYGPSMVVLAVPSRHWLEFWVPSHLMRHHTKSHCPVSGLEAWWSLVTAAFARWGVLPCFQEDICFIKTETRLKLRVFYNKIIVYLRFDSTFSREKITRGKPLTLKANRLEKPEWET